MQLKHGIDLAVAADSQLRNSSLFIKANSGSLILLRIWKF